MDVWNLRGGHIGGLWRQALGWVLGDPLLSLRGEIDFLHARWESRGITSRPQQRPTHTTFTLALVAPAQQPH
ncbi:MAG: hypothetical protein ABI831_08880 [Betaproteobacteria bacterium]